MTRSYARPPACGPVAGCGRQVRDDRMAAAGRGFFQCEGAVAQTLFGPAQGEPGVERGLDLAVQRAVGRGELIW